MDYKCFGMNVHNVAMLSLLILVDRLCFGRHKIDYIPAGPSESRAAGSVCGLFGRLILLFFLRGPQLPRYF